MANKIPQTDDEKRDFRDKLLKKADGRLYLLSAHALSSMNRSTLYYGGYQCGCFYCKRIFNILEIREGCDNNRKGEWRTALCPYCGIDSVLPNLPPVQLTKEFLQEMHDFWFAIPEVDNFFWFAIPEVDN